MTNKQGSVGDDEEAVAIAVAGEAGAVAAGSAVAGEAREVAAGSAVAGEAEPYVVWQNDADIEDDGFCPPCPEPKGLAEPIWTPACRSYIGEQSQPPTAEDPICFLQLRVPTKSTCPKFKK